MRSAALMRLLEDGSFLYVKGDAAVKLRIRSVATGDDVLRAKASGASALAAELFLPEAVEVARREGVELIDLEDVAEPLAEVVGALLRERRPDLLVRIFQELLPRDVARHYSYLEHVDFMTKDVAATSFKVELEFQKCFEFFEDILEFMSALAAKASGLGMSTSLNSTVDPRHKKQRITFEVSLDLA